LGGTPLGDEQSGREELPDADASTANTYIHTLGLLVRQSERVSERVIVCESESVSERECVRDSESTCECVSVKVREWKGGITRC